MLFRNWLLLWMGRFDDGRFAKQKFIGIPKPSGIARLLMSDYQDAVSRGEALGWSYEFLLRKHLTTEVQHAFRDWDQRIYTNFEVEPCLGCERLFGEVPNPDCSVCHGEGVVTKSTLVTGPLGELKVQEILTAFRRHWGLSLDDLRSGKVLFQYIEAKDPELAAAVLEELREDLRKVVGL